MQWYEKILNDIPKKEKSSFDFSFLKWKEDRSGKGAYILMSGEKIIGSLVFQDKKRKTAVGCINDYDFFIGKKGLISQRITITERSSNNELTLSVNNLDGEGELTFPDQDKINWKRIDELNNQWMFSDENNKPLIIFSPRSSFYLSGYNIDIRNEIIDDKLTHTLLLLGLFMLVSLSMDISLDSIFL